MTVRALVVAAGDPPSRAGLDLAWPGWDSEIGLVVGADGGALTAEALGLRLDLVVGDGDSLDGADLARLAHAGASIEMAPVAKDESDAELAVVAAVRRGADDISILGAFGGPRVDHELANIALLAIPAASGRALRLLDPRGRVSLIVAPGLDGLPIHRLLPGPAGSTVSLLPFDAEVEGVTTTAMQYPLNDEALPLGPARGLSNVRLSGAAAVTVRRGRLLVVEVPATLPE